MTLVDIENRIREATAAANAAAAATAWSQERGIPRFGDILKTRLSAQAALSGVTFSAHAQTRLASRQITLSADDITRLGAAMTRAAQKGARESLVLMDKAALVVSVSNRTVITAVDKSALKENIFTNIDSAMIV
jgi:flagellar operon protein